MNNKDIFLELRPVLIKLEQAYVRIKIVLQVKICLIFRLGRKTEQVVIYLFTTL